MTQYLTIWDLVLTPLYLLALSYIAKHNRDRRYPVGHVLRKYYLPGLYVKFAGAIFIALVYQYYYAGGDTYNFYFHSQVINSSLSDSLTVWLRLIFHTPVDVDPHLYIYVSQMYWYTDMTSYIIGVIGALFGLLNGTTYIPIALLFSFFAYTGIWAMFRTFTNIYPALHKQLAFAFLFIPSTFVWGSAMFKDTICMFGLGWLTYCTFSIFINKNFSFKTISLLVLSFYLLAVIKIYILLAYIPALSLWLLMIYSKRIHSIGLRWLTNLCFIGITVAGFLFFANRFSKELNEYSLENLAFKAKKTQGWITYVSDLQEGSAYDIGEFEPTMGGMLSKFPQAVNVTLYRPYLWEAKKPIVFLSALEALGFLAFTLYVFYKRGVVKTMKRIFTDPNLIFFFIYTLIFAFAVGISTGNFGSLSRYKIPCMPFFAALLIILYYSKKPPQKKETIHVSKQKQPLHHIT